MVSPAAGLLGLVGMVLATPVLAQDRHVSGQADGVLVYEADFFAGTQPNTAFDMVGRLPGFVFDGGGSVRGLSGAQGNVLIDGQRPASKSEDLENVVRRIPAAQVLRIEVIRGGAPGVDMQGLPVVANIIRRQGDRVEGALIVGAEGHDDGRWGHDAGFEISRSLSGDRRWELTGEIGRYIEGDAGDGRRERRDAAGRLIRSSRSDQDEGGEYWRLGGAWRQPLAGGVLSVNGLIAGEQPRWTLDDRITVPAVGRLRVEEIEDEREFEIGATWVRAMANGRLEVVGLQRRGDETEDSRAVGPGGSERFSSEEQTGESIVRVSLSRSLSSRWTAEGGVEGAFNWREGRASAEDNGVAVPLPASNVRVEEQRAEPFVTLSWRPSARWSLETGLRVETSRLSQSGDSQDERALTYAKPRAIVVWTPGAASQWRMRVEREVGQLSFGDFITSASLDTGQVSAGNIDLRPDVAWAVEGTYERRFWDTGALTLTVLHHVIDDAIDRAPVVTLAGGIFDAPGNIGRAERRAAQVRLTLPLDQMGLRGGLLKTFMEWTHSETTDPTTGDTRVITGTRPFSANAEFTHDLPQRGLQWGVVAYFGEAFRYFRFNETSWDRKQPWWSVFVEWKVRPNLSLNVEAANVTSRAFNRGRTVHEGPRHLHPVLWTEDRYESLGPVLRLRLRRALG